MAKLSPERLFWTQPKYVKVFKLVTEGKTPEEICDDLGIQYWKLINIFGNAFFHKRLQDWLNVSFYDYQIRKLHHILEVYNKMKAEFDKRVAKATDNAIVSEYLKMLSDFSQQKIIKADMINISYGVRTQEKKLNDEKNNVIPPSRQEELKNEFGYGPLEDEQSQNNRLDTEAGIKNKQGTSN